ncbi:hypothetical protein H2198_009403 [Neophaeococcomyces mojaviensis]|uniref:Uncharacterized protein n=1 Tax=Neophaeococcomyces mojaviensis TaxID=3383035 RepID=A0ACC2ZUG8_9EURO|nr:hypothetical protein H2198_009403 [Knufia sp. JES_112]
MHAEHANNWEDLQVLLPPAKSKARKDRRYECALCNGGKQFQKRGKGASGSASANTCLELHVKMYHPTWEDNWEVLVVEKRGAYRKNYLGY